MNKVLVFLLPILTFALGWGIHAKFFTRESTDSPIGTLKEEIGRPLDRYTIENLSEAKVPAGKFKMSREISDEEKYISNSFDFDFSPTLDKEVTKSTSGQINLPKGGNSSPLILMLRGYIDKEAFTTGDGTRRAAEYFAQNGFITVAPDFLGYGNSDEEAGNIFETRFQTYVTVLSLIKSLNQIERWNGEDIFLWGHSNGGHITLTILEITGASYPTTLWAPVSKPFPYSVLYYTDQSVDNGKLIRSELAKFESIYDVEKYSLANYLDKINAPLQIQQGEADDAVPLSWSNALVFNLKKLDKEVTYYTYPGTDHNMRPSWDEAVQKDLEFFQNYLK